MLFALLVLVCSWLQASIAAQDDHYNIGESERMSITGAVFHAYENAWSVSFLVPDVYSLLVFALCREPCPHKGSSGAQHKGSSGAQ
jgi:hypothetical protein